MPRRLPQVPKGHAHYKGIKLNSVQVVGVHGIRQWDTNAHRLAEDWQSALTRGMSHHLGAAVTVPGLITPYYGDVFPKTKLLQLGQANEPALDDLTDPDEIAFVTEMLHAYAPDMELPEAEPTLGVPPRTPAWLTRWIAGLDGEWGQGVGERTVTRIRELHGYLTNSEAAERARQRIIDAFTGTAARLVIAHSLGSVIVYDMFHRDQIPSAGNGADGVNTLITCGSPLGWLPLQRQLAIPGRLQLPGTVTWVNIFDPRDPVTAGQGLSDSAATVTDTRVHNGGDPHSVRKYLRQEALARAVQTALA